jgi:hypothetical protein
VPACVSMPAAVPVVGGGAACTVLACVRVNHVQEDLDPEAVGGVN